MKATSFRIRDEGAVSAVWVAGRLGASEDRELRGVARSLRLAGVRLLVLDLQDVREIDLHGLVAVLEIEAETRERAGWELAVVPPSIQVEPQFWAADLRSNISMVAREDARSILDSHAAGVDSTFSSNSEQRGH